MCTFFSNWTNGVNAELLILFQCNWLHPAILFAKVLDWRNWPRTTIAWHNVNIKIPSKHKLCINFSNVYSCRAFEKIKPSYFLLQEFDNSNTISLNFKNLTDIESSVLENTDPLTLTLKLKRFAEGTLSLVCSVLFRIRFRRTSHCRSQTHCLVSFFSSCFETNVLFLQARVPLNNNNNSY